MKALSNRQLGLIGMASIEDFGTNVAYGSRLAYHVTEDYFGELVVGATQTGKTSYELPTGAQAVPEVLLSGHHARIERFRREASLAVTAAARPDVLTAVRAQGGLSKADELWLARHSPDKL